MRHKPEEYILCAAIHFQNGFTEGTVSNVKEGVIVCGRRHSDCYNILKGIVGDVNSIDLIGRDHQGFMTSKNRYVGRKEAYQIALQAEQVEPRKPLGDEAQWEKMGLGGVSDEEILTSEDLY